MRVTFHPFLLNGPQGDPALWVDLPGEGRSILLDLGDLTRASSRKLLRVDRVVVSHTHMDHFVGFDRLLRLALRRERELTVTGPAGFLERVRGKISAYTWNLVESYPIRLVAEELQAGVLRAERYTGPGRMRPEPLPDRTFEGTLFAHRSFRAHVAELDHGIPVLGTLLAETERLSVNKDRLTRLGLRPGPWLDELKGGLRRGLPPDTPLAAETGRGVPRRFTLGELAAELITRGAGQRIAYFTDLAHTPANVRRVTELARDVDLMVCEAGFLDRDAELARERRHLTARQAGELARAAGARRLAPFHFSPRYGDAVGELIEEARAAFGGEVVLLPASGDAML
jgi:ribonuclease Z